MSSDRRWTGGAANREWQRGTQPQAAPDAGGLTAHVAQYLAECRAHQQLLDRRYHPTEEGALKVIFHRGRDQETAIRLAFRQLTAI